MPTVFLQSGPCSTNFCVGGQHLFYTFCDTNHYIKPCLCFLAAFSSSPFFRLCSDTSGLFWHNSLCLPSTQILSKELHFLYQLLASCPRNSFFSTKYLNLGQFLLLYDVLKSLPNNSFSSTKYSNLDQRTICRPLLPSCLRARDPTRKMTPPPSPLQSRDPRREMTPRALVRVLTQT